MIEINSQQRRALRAAAHALQPVVSISQKGLSNTVVREIDRCLKAHELIKVRVYDAEREARAVYLAEICSALDAAPVQHIGNLLVIWRPQPQDAAEKTEKPRKPRVRLSKKAEAAKLEKAGRAKTPVRAPRKTRSV